MEGSGSERSGCGSRDWSDTATTQGMQALLEAEKQVEGSLESLEVAIFFFSLLGHTSDPDPYKFKIMISLKPLNVW